MGEDQLDDLELDGPITLKILDGTARDFAQAKWWRWWKTVRCGGLISSFCPRNPHGKAGNEERRRTFPLQFSPFFFKSFPTMYVMRTLNEIFMRGRLIIWLKRTQKRNCISLKQKLKLTWLLIDSTQLKIKRTDFCIRSKSSGVLYRKHNFEIIKLL